MAANAKRNFKILGVLILTAALFAGLVGAFPSVSDAAQKKSIKKAKVKVVKTTTYTGEKVKPKVTVKLGKTKLKKNRDYTVAYKNNKKVGTAVVTVTGIGAYKGTVKKKFKIIPNKTKLTSIISGEKKLAPTWKKVSKDQADGYVIQYSTKSNFAKSKKAVVKGWNNATTVIKVNKDATTYYVRVCAYKTVTNKKGKSKNYFSKWSKVMSAKTKKAKPKEQDPEEQEETKHTHHWVAKTHTEDHGNWEKIIEEHTVCFYCNTILDDMSGIEQVEHCRNCNSASGSGNVTVGAKWVPNLVTYTDYYYCPECGKKKTAPEGSSEKWVETAPSHTHNYVARNYSGDHGFWRGITEGHLYCSKCKMYLDDKDNDFISQHCAECGGNPVYSDLVVDKEWVKKPVSFTEYHCSICGKKKPE